MPVLSRGAQRASSHRLVATVFAATFLATLVVVPVSPALPGGGVVAQATTTAPWLTTEQWYLKLINCNRTGGRVRSDGSCDGYGSGTYSPYVAPLRLHLSISNRVSRPWAKWLAVNNRCAHGDPGARLRRAGFTSWRWAENIGCGSGYPSAKAAVLANHLAFQDEQATNGYHWQNLRSTRYTYIGIGIWRSGSRVRLVTDFYRPG